MDDRRFDALARAVGDARSRRGFVRLLGGLGAGMVALRPTEPLAAKSGRCTRTCGECQECHKGKCFKHHGRKVCKSGTCKPKANGIGCSGGGRCEAGACVGFAGCPPACPACQACPSSASLCAAQPNGQPGHQCEDPKVCCNGTCCEFIHQCNSDGNCATCKQACPEGCDLCLTLSDGRKVCGGRDSHCTGGDCSDCPVDLPFTPACVTSVTDRATNTTRQDCGVQVGTGTCWDIAPCCPPCPVCQDCNLTTGSCQVFSQNNGQPGRDCASPKVCCNGACSEFCSV
jgi:hypothetical protein